MTEYRVPFQDAESEFTEKRSRFLSHLFRVESEAEARRRIEEMKKKYYDARHNCWCYLIEDGGIVRYSDDGEPQGTAGRLQRLLRGDPVLRRRAAGSRRAHESLQPGSEGCAGRRRHLPDGPLDPLGHPLSLRSL